MSEIFHEFLSNLNQFQQKLRRLPSGLLSDPEISNFAQKKSVKIVVIGGVGVGKSSVVERVVGMETIRLPKGKDGCTRRPCIIKLGTENIPGAAHTEFNEDVRIITEIPLIVDLTKNIKPAMMSVELIDLPGISSMSRPDQSSDYPAYTQSLFDSHVSSADIILLCLPVDADIATSDALRRLTDLGVREEIIIGVLSKVDLLEGLENLKEFIEVLRSFGSIVAVRNAPHLEINNPISITNTKESEFFSNSSTAGISRLRSEILRLLSDQFTKIKNQISIKLIRQRNFLDFKMKSISNPNFTLNLVTKYVEYVSKEIRNERIRRLFWKALPDALESIDPLEGIDLTHLKVLIKNSQVKQEDIELEINPNFRD